MDRGETFRVDFQTLCFHPFFYQGIFYLRGFPLKRQRTIGLKSHLLKVASQRKLMPRASQRLHWTSSLLIFLIFSLFHTQPDILRENLIFSSIQSVKVKTSFISGWEMSLVCKILHVNKLQRLTKVLDKSSIVCPVVYNDFEKEVRVLSSCGHQCKLWKTWQEFVGVCREECKVFSPFWIFEFSR